MPEVRIEHISKHYGDAPVLHDFSLTIHDGEFFTLLGPSGCGKTTLINLVAGLDHIDSGEIYFDERQVSTLSPKDRDVAMVFQSYALYPHKTVAENLAFPLRVNKQPKAKIESEVRRVSALLGLAGLLEKKPAEISGGERQRVALGRALIREPAVFLMDEPLSNLDAQLRVQTRAEIKQLHRTLKRTTIYVTHDQDEALSLSDRLAVMDRGEVIQVGTPEEIYRAPAHLTVAKFIGSPQMNMIPGRLMPGTPLQVDVGSTHIAVCSSELPEQSMEPEPREVIVGLRPEDIRVQQASKGQGARVLDIEHTGSRVWVDLVWGDHRVKALAAGDLSITRDQLVALDIDPTCLHLFDTRSGDRLP